MGIVVSKTIGDSGWRDVKSGSDGGGAGHVGNSWFGVEEAGDVEGVVTKAEASFAAFTVKFRIIDFEVRIGGSAVAYGFGFAAEVAKSGIVSIVTIKDNNFWIHMKEAGFGAKISFEIGVVKTGWNKIG